MSARAREARSEEYGDSSTYRIKKRIQGKIEKAKGILHEMQPDEDDR